MTQQILLTLPDEVFHRAEGLAEVMARPVEAVLADTLALALPDLPSSTEPPISALADTDVLNLTQAKLPPAEDERLSILLDKQQSGHLTPAERPELLALFQNYLRLWLRQSEALAEAVQRGLRPPLHA
jgi:hypothetical protein